MKSHSHDAATEPRNVAHAIVSKNQDIFIMSEHGGGIPSGNQDGFGLYYHDCRYLDGYEISLAGTTPNPLVSSSGRGSIANFEMTNSKLQVKDGSTIQSQTFGLRLQRSLHSKDLCVCDVFTIENYDVVDHELLLSLNFHSSFEDIFVIRGLHPKNVGKANQPQWDDGTLVLSYDGADGVNRRLQVTFDPKPSSTSGSEAQFDLKLRADTHQQLTVSMHIIETRKEAGTSSRQTPNANRAQTESDDRARNWLEQHTDFESDNPILNTTVRRCLLDLLMLTGSLEGYEYFAAGIPWYGTLFGRDSIIAALETLAFEPRMAEQTLRLLASKQGTKVDEWKDEAPGKILHELRRGELANLNEIPQTPYYGSVDSTPLFLILIGQHARWTGRLDLFQELRSNVERALGWIDQFGDQGNGYVTYATKSKKGLNNQGWKDSHDGIMNADGSLATPPIALAEVQGYVYMAKLLIADLYSRSGDHTTAQSLTRQAQALKERFNRDFWVAEKNCYAIALQKDNRPAAVIGSNPGQALWTGIVDDARASGVVRTLMAEDMFSGWGIRTLSMKERRANPVGYHLGSVWPHDNAIIAAGFRRYGFDNDALQVMDGIAEAAGNFEHNRLPEVFAGYAQQQFQVPVRYPVACHPQAWAAGSVPYLLTSLLGIVPDAFGQTVNVIRPVLPKSVKELHLRRMKVGDGCVDLHFQRTSDGSVRVSSDLKGTIQVSVEAEPSPREEAA